MGPDHADRRRRADHAERRAIGANQVHRPLGATRVRFLFGLPFALVFLALAPVLTGAAIAMPGLCALGFTASGALTQIGGTALVLFTQKSQNFAVTTA